ncbi:MAG: thiol:disulfide interchange protein DsbA/DsbL [Paraperlucidibaca sp.]
MKKFLTVLLLALPTWAMALTPVEGKDYTRLANPTPALSNGMVEVREFFWYGCPHCYTLEPHVATWLKTKPAGVQFERSPAALNAVWEANARGYYVAESLGLVEKTHGPLFAAIQVDKQRLFSQKSLAGFYAGFGVKEANFNGLYNSFTVSAKVAQSRNLAMRYQLTGVPAMVVNGKYLVPGESARTIEVVKALVAQEQARRK